MTGRWQASCGFYLKQFVVEFSAIAGGALPELMSPHEICKKLAWMSPVKWRTMYGPVSRSPLTPCHIFYRKHCWYLHYTVMYGLSWPQMEVCCSVDSITGLFSKQNVVNHLGLILTQYKNSRWLDMYADLRCSVHLICVNAILCVTFSRFSCVE